MHCLFAAPGAGYWSRNAIKDFHLPHPHSCDPCASLEIITRHHVLVCHHARAVVTGEYSQE